MPSVPLEIAVERVRRQFAWIVPEYLRYIFFVFEAWREKGKWCMLLVAPWPRMKKTKWYKPEYLLVIYDDSIDLVVKVRVLSLEEYKSIRLRRMLRRKNMMRRKKRRGEKKKNKG